MSRYSHLNRWERDQIAELKAAGRSVRAIARALGRAASTISRELRRNALDGGAYRPQIADGGYLLRRQRPSLLERDRALAAYVTDRLIEGWTPEQIAGRLKRGIERGLRVLSTETCLGLDLPRRLEGPEALALPATWQAPSRPAQGPGLERYDQG